MTTIQEQERKARHSRVTWSIRNFDFALKTRIMSKAVANNMTAAEYIEAVFGELFRKQQAGEMHGTQDRRF